MGAIRSTQAWRKLSKRVAREEPVCWLNLPGCTRRSTTGDHVIPVSMRPDLALVRSNVHGACSPCNRKRGNLPVELARQLHCNTGQFGHESNMNSQGRQSNSPSALGFFGAK